MTLVTLPPHLKNTDTNNDEKIKKNEKDGISPQRKRDSNFPQES